MTLYRTWVYSVPGVGLRLPAVAVLATSLVLVGSFLPAGAAAAYEVVKVANGGGVAGVANYSGAVPRPKKIPVTRDRKICGSEPKTSDDLLVSPAGGVKNVVVFLDGVKQGKAFSDGPVEVDQRGCWFVPHVVLVRAGQPFILLNSDNVLHNFRTPGSPVNRALNKAQPKFKRRLPIKIKNPDIILANCDIHEWMSAVFVVMAHPYYTLTDESGAFSLSDVPPGRYTLSFWHEVLGKQSREVVVTAGGEAKVTAEFKGR